MMSRGIGGTTLVCATGVGLEILATLAATGVGMGVGRDTVGEATTVRFGLGAGISLTLTANQSEKERTEGGMEADVAPVGEADEVEVTAAGAAATIKGRGVAMRGVDAAVVLVIDDEPEADDVEGTRLATSGRAKDETVELVTVDVDETEEIEAVRCERRWFGF